MASPTQPTINTYVSDMLALEKHILGPLEHQTKDDAVSVYTDASRAINEAYSMTVTRIDALSARLEALGGHAGEPVKSAVASTLGAAAAAIGNVRKTEVSKYLRDDYAAFALSSAGYSMLHTTALALGDTTTAQLAQDGLTQVATSVLRLSKSIPVTVLAELREEGVAVDASIATEAENDVKTAWQDGGARSSN